MIIGIDFDNTIVCYDGVFHRAALEAGLIDSSIGMAKNDVRDSLRKRNMFDEWTALQGEVYGRRMDQARAFPGVRETLEELHQSGIHFLIISHKTQFAKKGPKYDLHEAAMNWLEAHGFFGDKTGLNKDGVFFRPTRHEKIEQIKRCECTHFIDDLPEVFLEPAFPEDITKILFAPLGYRGDTCFNACASWKDVSNFVIKELKTTNRH